MLRARLHRRRFIKLVTTAPIAGLAAGYSSAERGPPVPAALADQVTVLGIPNARFWADTQGAALAAEGCGSRGTTVSGDECRWRPGGSDLSLPSGYWVAGEPAI